MSVTTVSIPLIARFALKACDDLLFADELLGYTDDDLTQLDSVSIREFRNFFIAVALYAAKLSQMSLLAAMNGYEERFVVVPDEMNNVNRRCNIRGGDDTESRCWEVLAQVECERISNPTPENRIYFVHYVGKKKGNNVFRYVFASKLTNLY